MKKLFLLSPLVFSSLFAAPAITVYNGGFGVVRDTVPLDLKGGISEISYSGVTTQLEPESVVLRDPAGNIELSVIEQSYRGDPVDQMRLLQMFEGKTIRFSQMVGEHETIREGRIVRAPSSMMVTNQYGNQQLQNLEPIVEVEGELQTRLPGVPLFPSLGDDSILEPTLTWKLFSQESAQLEAQLSYLTGGMSWKADYNLVLPEKGDVVTLNGWVSIENNTGKTFEDAKIKLIAGDVNKVADTSAARAQFAYDVMESRSLARAAPEVEAKKFDEFHMYALPLASTLRDRETKQIEFVRADQVKTKKLYVYNGSSLGDNWRYRNNVNNNQNYGVNSNPDIEIYREFVNSKGNGLGVALPAGKTRFYRMDSDGQLEFTGENIIDHTPKNEDIRVYLGNAFDLVGEREQSDYYVDPSRKVIREQFKIQIRNQSEEPVEVQVVEPLYRWANWKILKNSHDFDKMDSRTIEFSVPIEAEGVETIRYTVEYRW